MNPLRAIEQWPVPNAAAAALGPDGTVLRSGDTTAPFAIASLTKPLSTVAILVSVEEGSVSLDDPCGPPGATLRDLLAHCAGYAFDSDEQLAEPRTRRIYSNTGIEVAAAHVADRTGFPFEQYLREAVLEPLGLASTELNGSPAAGAISSVDDLLRLVRAVLSGELIAFSTAALMTTVFLPGLDGVLPGFGQQRPNPWGLGVEIRGSKSPHWTSPANSANTWGHFGGTGTMMWHVPGADVSLIALTDRPFGDWALPLWPELGTAVLARFA